MTVPVSLSPSWRNAAASISSGVDLRRTYELLFYNEFHRTAKKCSNLDTPPTDCFQTFTSIQLVAVTRVLRSLLMWLSSLSLRNRKSNEVKLTERFFSSLVKVSSEMLVIVPVIDAIFPSSK